MPSPPATAIGHAPGQAMAPWPRAFNPVCCGMCGYRVTCAAPPTRPFPRPGRGRQAAGHSPVGSDVSWTLGSPAVRSSGTTIGSAASYEQPASILAYWAAPSLPDAVGARNGSQRVQTSPDPALRSHNLLADQRLPVRLSPTVTDTPEFPDTEEVTGSNPVRPTPFFENLSSGESHNESQRPAVLSLNSWSERSTLRPTHGFPRRFGAPSGRFHRARISLRRSPKA